MKDNQFIKGAGASIVPPSATTETGGGSLSVQNSYTVVRRNGVVVPFDQSKISVALSKAFIAVRGQNMAVSAGVRDIVDGITQQVTSTLAARKQPLTTFNIEEIQDQVELALMRGGHHDIARAYVLYREERAQARQQKAKALMPGEIHIVGNDGVRRPLDAHELGEVVAAACDGLPETDAKELLRTVLRDLYDGINDDQLATTLIMTARSRIEREPSYSQVAARLLLDKLRTEVFGAAARQGDPAALYARNFNDMIEKGVAAELVNPALAEKFDLERLSRLLAPARDLQFGYLGLQTLYDRYFLHVDGGRIELPQTFFMRVAMGLALNEAEPTARAAEFYELLSSFRFMSSTPTLFNSGTLHSQLSSCYLTTVADGLDEIFTAYKENALLAKYAGGLGNDWTPVRAMGAYIKGTNGKSQGVIPFLKLVNDTAVAVNQGGKRKGAVCAYLETWHLDIVDFLSLRKNTGDERRRTHDMNTANWIPDLFMKRVCAGGEWTLFSPDETPDLHDLFGAKFERRYQEYEKMAAEGNIQHKTMPAIDLWRRMLSMLFETGHPWITFKDACNVRSPQQHAGVVHSSNLCTEITLNTNDKEIAVCNLGSVNLLAHMRDGELDREKLAATIKTAMRMLDNVIDINFYAVEKAKNANVLHRPVGLGLMGFQDCLYEQGISYDSPEAVEFADRAMEAVCYEAYWASTELAQERGAYQSFAGSLWSRGILPHDTLRLLARERNDEADASGELMPVSERLDGDYLQADVSQTLDWEALRKRIREHGMRNSNCVAIAPTATIANIVGVTASIEPTYQNIYVKSNLSGDFTVSNRHLVGELKRHGLWDDVMLQDIKYFEGRLNDIDRIPEALRRKYPTAFEIEPKWLIECAARRQKWIDQAQSLNLYIDRPSGKKLDEMYKLAWRRGLKTTYYLRSLGASSTEGYTTKAGKHNAVPVNGGVNGGATAAAPSCGIGDEGCEVCQ